MNAAALERIVLERLQAVEQRISAACHRSGRSRQDVTIVAVTKTISGEFAALLPEWGIQDLGENRPQELAHKADHRRKLQSCEIKRKEIRWHMIGHLQRNKIQQILPLTTLIHSVDSIRLLQALDKEAAGHGVVPVLLQINTSGEASKQGFDAAEVAELAPAIRALTHAEVRGLMTMAPFQEPETCRPFFARLRSVRDDLQEILGPGHSLKALSMGMSNDFEIAVEEGATLVRLGTMLFGGLEKEPGGSLDAAMPL
jgi:pyridoxal phosphate enzyme (YggS family)